MAATRQKYTVKALFCVIDCTTITIRPQAIGYYRHYNNPIKPRPFMGQGSLWAGFPLGRVPFGSGEVDKRWLIGSPLGKIYTSEQ